MFAPALSGLRYLFVQFAIGEDDHCCKHIIIIQPVAFGDVLGQTSYSIAVPSNSLLENGLVVIEGAHLYKRHRIETLLERWLQ